MDEATYQRLCDISESLKVIAEVLSDNEVQKCKYGHKYFANSHEYPCPICQVGKLEAEIADRRIMTNGLLLASNDIRAELRKLQEAVKVYRCSINSPVTDPKQALANLFCLVDEDKPDMPYVEEKNDE